MYRVLACDGMAKGAIAKLESMGYEVIEEFYEPEVLAEKVKECDALVVRSATKVRKPVIDAAAQSGRLKIIIRGGVGVDNIDVDYAQSKGIQVVNTPNASSVSVAELAIGHMFSLARYIGIANVTMRQGQWEKKSYKGIELTGKTLGLLGIGRIAREVARRAAAMGMRVIYFNRSGHKKEYEPYVRVELDELLAQSDFISLHMPAEKGAAPLIDAETIARMKEGVFFINTARGSLVDEEALLNALDSGRIAGAGLDVFQEEPTKNQRILNHPKISMTPHVGGSTKEAQNRIGEEIVEHITSVLGT